MRISSVTIDCYLSISSASVTNYSDFQHHHWEIMPSGQIGTGTLNNIPTYTWSVNCMGSDSSGSWSTPMGQSVTVTNGAQARITSPNTVSLTQTTGFGTHTIHVVGSNKATDHDVSEMIWLIPPPMPGGTSANLITWDANAGLPSMITYQDMGHPTYSYQLTYGPPTFIPSGQTAPFTIAGTFVANPILSSFPSGVVGGRDWTNGAATFYQVPSPRTALAWWTWTITLVQ
jgi:hypothetical protein